MNANEKRHAEFSADRVYRYTLSITWDDQLPRCQFIGLNPSTADERNDDPTIRRCRNFSKAWGFGGFVMTNLFAFRSPYPPELQKAQSPIGERGHFITAAGFEFSNRNDFWLYSTRSRCTLTVACWGCAGNYLDRAVEVARRFRGMMCLGHTVDGHPKHPVRLAKSSVLVPYVAPSTLQ